MYINIPEKVRCSQCGSLNNYETVDRKSFIGLETIKRCIKCKHEKVVSILTTSSTGGQTIYNKKANEETSF